MKQRILEALAIALAIAACQPAPAPEQTAPAPAPAPAPEQTASGAEIVDTLTQEQYDRIQEGMTLQQVREILGGQGLMIDDHQQDGLTAEMWTWQTPDRAIVFTIGFTNGELTLKSESGLK